MRFTADDARFMARALKLARHGLYTTHPNPRVGCVIVKHGAIISEGWHLKTGGPHAEACAINRASECLSGATVYVTLEPCCHHGRTAPCTQALIDAGVGRVLIAAKDPNTDVRGGGADVLAKAGIDVAVGLLEEQARELNKGFYSLYEKRRPWIRLKAAASLDGKTAMASGESQWITSQAARHDGQLLRAQSAAVLTGIDTLLADDPKLNVRLAGVDRQPARVILDSQCRTPVEAKIFAHPGEIIIFTGSHTPSDKIASLEQRGASIVQQDLFQGRLDLSQVLEALSAMRFNEIHVEAGRTLNGEMIRQNLADEIVIYLAPALLGSEARGMFLINQLDKLSARKKLTWHDRRLVGEDLRLTMRLCN